MILIKRRLTKAQKLEIKEMNKWVEEQKYEQLNRDLVKKYEDFGKSSSELLAKKIQRKKEDV